MLIDDTPTDDTNTDVDAAAAGSDGALVDLSGAGADNVDGDGDDDQDDARDSDDNDTGGNGDDAPATTEIELDGEKVEVSEAVAKHIEDLKADAKTEVPEAYDLVVPDDLKDVIEVDAADPRWSQLQEVAKAKGWSQETVNDILALHYGDLAASAAEDEKFGTDEKAKLIKAFNDGGKLSDEKAMKAAQGNADWVAALLKPAIKKNPGLVNELKSIAVTADGVQLMAALRDAIKEVRPPKTGDGDPNPEMSTEDYFKEIFKT